MESPLLLTDQCTIRCKKKSLHRHTYLVWGENHMIILIVIETSFDSERQQLHCPTPHGFHMIRMKRMMKIAIWMCFFSFLRRLGILGKMGHCLWWDLEQRFTYARLCMCVCGERKNERSTMDMDDVFHSPKHTIDPTCHRQSMNYPSIIRSFSKWRSSEPRIDHPLHPRWYMTADR